MQQHIEADFLKPLAARDQDTSKFSRMRMPPMERRARMTMKDPAHDSAGRAFLSFSIDQRFTGGDWQENAITGCVNTEKGEMFVKIGDGFRPASYLLGQNADATPGVCVAAPAKA